MGTQATENPASGAPRLCLLGEAVLQPAPGAPPLPFAPERRFQLLAYLAHQGEWVARERLAALFWPEHSAEAARSNLRKVLFRVKALAGLPPIEEHNGALRWAVATDLQAFEQQAAAGDAGALALWRGEPWLGLDADAPPPLATWLAFERQRLHSCWRQLQLGLARSEARADQAGTWARQLLAHDELDEEALVLLMKAELRAGRRAAALQAFHGFEQALRQQLGLEPAAATRALLDELAAEAAAPVAGPGLVGRQAELRELHAQLLQPGCRWLTLSGPGGIGKTALARQALPGLAAEHADGALAVALEDLADDGLACARVAEHLAAHLGLALAGHRDGLAQVAEALRTRSLLLLLDNLEPLQPAARRIHAALAGCPGVRVLATSRERLGLADEHVLALQGLPWPAADDTDRAAAFDAVRLFTRHALASQPAFRLEAQAAAVVALCERVEGHPLALRLAAAWTRHFSVAEILRELDGGSEWLAAEGWVGGRHRSIAATLGLSWQRLVAAEKRLLLRLSVFHGGFTLDAARAVAGASLAALAALIDKSLVRRDETPPGAAPRFSLHPLLLQFAAARHEPADRQAARLAHAQFHLALLARFPRGRWSEHAAWFSALDPDIENLRAAWHEGVARGLVPLLAGATIGLTSHFHDRGRGDDGIQLLATAEAVLQPEPLALAQLQCSIAMLEAGRSNYERTAELARLSLRTTRRRGDARLVRAGLFLMGNALLNQGHYGAAFRCYQEALQRARAQGDGHGVAMNLSALAEVATQAGRLDEALSLARQSLDTQAGLGLQNVDSITDLAHALRLAGQHDAARQAFARATAALDPQRRGPEHSYLAYHHALACWAWGERAELDTLLQRALDGLALGGQPVVAIGVRLLQAAQARQAGRLAEAGALLREAAADASARRLPPWQLDALLQVAELALAGGDPTRAAALLALVRGHPASSHETRQHAATLAAGLPVHAAPSLGEALAALLQR